MFIWIFLLNPYRYSYFAIFYLSLSKGMQWECVGKQNIEITLGIVLSLILFGTLNDALIKLLISILKHALTIPFDTTDDFLKCYLYQKLAKKEGLVSFFYFLTSLFQFTCWVCNPRLSNQSAAWQQKHEWSYRGITILLSCRKHYGSH